MNKTNKSADDSISANMLHKNYHVALVLLVQLQKENQKLSEKNQIQYLECLYQTKRYIECLEYSKRFSDAGNNRKELMFLRGLSYYKLSQYQNALQIFEKYSEWSRWEEKCQFMLNLNKNTERIIQIGEPQVIPDPNTVNIEMYQSNSVVTVTLLIKGLIIDQLKITPLPYSLDIVIDYGHKKFTKSLELYDEIIPKSMELNLTPKKLEIKLEKVHYTKWPTLEKAESDIIGDTNVSLNELIKELDIIPNYTDEEASNLFEQSQSELKQSIKQMTK